MGVVDGGMNPVFNVLGETLIKLLTIRFGKLFHNRHDLSQLFKLGFYFVWSADAVNVVDQCSDPYFDSLVRQGTKP